MDAIDKAATRVRHADGPDRAGRPGRPRHGRATPGKVHGSRPTPTGRCRTPILDELVKAGRLGPEVGRGLPQARRQGDRPEPDPAFARDPGQAPDRRPGARTTPEITDRLFLPMLLEATRVLEEGIVREPADVDMGLILGIGFPPFRGGILRWCRHRGRGQDPRAARRNTRRSASGSSRPRRLTQLARDRRDVLSDAQAAVDSEAGSARDRPYRSTTSNVEEHTMRHAVVIDAVRTPIGRASADKGYFRDVRVRGPLGPRASRRSSSGRGSSRS